MYNVFIHCIHIYNLGKFHYTRILIHIKYKIQFVSVASDQAILLGFNSFYWSNRVFNNEIRF